MALSDSVLVRYDYAKGRPVPLSVEHIAAMEAREGQDAHDRLISVDAPNASSVFASNGRRVG